MRNGFTTGSCAAAASKAAAWMLLGGNRKETIEIDTPAGVKYAPALEDVTALRDRVRCAGRKDAGDGPDITSGTRMRRYAARTAVRAGSSSKAAAASAG